MIFGEWNLPIVKWTLNDGDDGLGFDFLPIIGESQGIEARKAKHVTDFMLNTGLF